MGWGGQGGGGDGELTSNRKRKEKKKKMRDAQTAEILFHKIHIQFASPHFFQSVFLTMTDTRSTQVLLEWWGFSFFFSVSIPQLKLKETRMIKLYKSNLLLNFNFTNLTKRDMYQ